MTSATELRFALPPSLGSAEALARARAFGDHLARLLGTRVSLVVAADYRALREVLLRNEADAIWAPPFVCARLETKGVRVALRGVRGGASTYRAALVCRRDGPLTLETLGGTRAAWVDPDSVGGHLLAVALLRSKGLDPAKLFREQRFAGSYRDALLAVAWGEAEVASVFAPPGAPDSKLTNLAEVLPEQAESFAVVAFSDESPNDGVVLSANLGAAASGALTGALLELHTSAEGRALLGHAFRIDRFEVAPPGGYRSLYRVAIAAL